MCVTTKKEATRIRNNTPNHDHGILESNISNINKHTNVYANTNINVRTNININTHIPQSDLSEGVLAEIDKG